MEPKETEASDKKTEPFEEWISSNTHMDMHVLLDMNLRDYEPPMFALITHIIHYANVMNDMFANPQDLRYGYIAGAIGAYHASIIRKDPKAVTFAAEANKLCRAIYRLDTETGHGKHLEPWMSLEEHEKCLRILDVERECFKEIVKETLEALKGNRVLISFFLSIARISFALNGYQGPLRYDAAKASRDAMGLTDLFSEMMEEELGYHDEPMPLLELIEMYPRATFKGKLINEE